MLLVMHLIAHGHELVRWFHGKIKREDAEKLLLAMPPGDGMYLFRESESSPGGQFIPLV